MAKIFSDIEKIQRNINELNKAINVYSEQEKQLQNIINELSGVWNSDAGEAFVQNLSRKKRLLELNREIMEDIVKVTEKRYRLLMKIYSMFRGRGNGGF